MPHFRVALSGENFILALQGSPSRYGFQTTRFVEADGAEAAEHAAVELLRGEPKLADLLNPRDSPPMVYADDIARVDAGDVPETQPGLVFYRQEPDA